MQEEEKQALVFDFILTHSWKETQEQFGITSRGKLKSIIFRTALGYPCGDNVTGRLPYLSPPYEERLADILSQKASEHNCISSSDVLFMAKLTKAEMFADARRALFARRCSKLAQNLAIEPDEPCPKWLNAFVERHSLRIVEGQGMEVTRSMACEKSRVIEYFLRWLPLFNRDPRLIFGMDETDVRPNFRQSVVTTMTQQGHVNKEDMKHLTAVCAHGAAGASVPPMFILENLKTLPNELRKPDLCGPDIAWYVSTKKGWMTEGSFYIWSLLFLHWLSQYRATVLPPNLKNMNVLLIMDGHSSRRSPEAIELFWFHNVTVLILPAHMTHLLQPFDCLLASALKASFKRFLSSEKEYLKKANNCPETDIGRKRVATIRSFIRSWAAVSQGPLAARSFEKAGIFPPSYEGILSSPFVVENVADVGNEHSIISNNLLTNEQIYQVLKEEKLPQRKDPSHQVITPDWDSWKQTKKFPFIKNTVEWMKNRDVFQGRLLCDPPSLFYPINGIWQLVECFQQNSNFALSPIQIMNQMRRLSMLEHDRAENNLELEVNKIAQQKSIELQANIVKATAKRMAQEVALQLAQSRIPTVVSLIQQELDTAIITHINELNIGEATKNLLLQNISNVTKKCIDKVTKWTTENQNQ